MKILQFICSTGFYGAERWVLALSKHMPSSVTSELAVTLEPGTEDLELVKQFQPIGKTHHVPMHGRFDLGAVKKLAALIKDNNIDIIHTHGYKSDILGLWRLKKQAFPAL